MGHTCHINKDMLHIWRRTSIHVYEEVRVFYRYSMYITDLVIFTIILNQAYGTLSFSPLKKNHTIAFKRNHIINYFNKVQ